MIRKTHTLMLATLAATGLLLAGCSQQPAAQTAIAGIEAAVTAAGADAAKYIPDDVAGINGKLADLKKAFDAKDYKAVVAGAPAILALAKGLVAAAATKKEEVVNMATADWGSLSTSLPGMVAAVQSRVNVLGKSRSLPAGVNLDTAKSALAEATEGWAKAQAASTAGNVEDAAAMARMVKDKATAAAAALNLTLPGA